MRYYESGMYLEPADCWNFEETDPIAEDRDAGYRAAINDISVRGLEYAINFADEPDLEDPWWFGYAEALEERGVHFGC